MAEGGAAAAPRHTHMGREAEVAFSLFVRRIILTLSF